MNKVINTICAGLAVFAMGYVLVHLAPLFGYLALVISVMYGYALLDRRVRNA